MFYLLYTVCYLFSLLPFRVLYGLADLAYLLLYYIVGYRRDIVKKNLQLSFPEKSEKEIDILGRQYYRNLADMVVETIKGLSISKKQLQKRFRCNFSVLEDFYAQGRSGQVHMGHLFNWEWANLYFRLGTKVPFLVVYMPVSNKAVDRLMMKMRSRFGSIMIPANDVQQAMRPWQNKPYICTLVADQNPVNPRRCYWVPFLHRATAFYKGPELSARRGDIPVFFGSLRKVKRGYYDITLRLAFDHPQQEPEGAVTAAFVRFLEDSILQQPPAWLWSHRRWKHRYNPDRSTLITQSITK